MVRRFRPALAHVIGAYLPALALLAYWVYAEFLQPVPFSHSSRYDPETPYLFNSLGLIVGQPYAYYHHPGTPLEVVGTFLLVLVRIVIGRTTTPFPVRILENPELFFRASHALLAIASVIGVVWIVTQLDRKRSTLGLLAATAIALTFFAAYPGEGLRTLTYWSHNSLAFPGGTLLLFGLYLRLRTGRAILGREFWLWGALTGILAACQLYFATWTIGVGVSLVVFDSLQGKGWGTSMKHGLWVLGGSALGFHVALLPVLDRYRDFVNWVLSLILHQGIYGGGPTGIFSWQQLLVNVQMLATKVWLPLVLTTLCFGLLMASILLRKRWVSPGAHWWPLAIGVSVQLVATLALILKHPSTHYMLAPASICPLLLLLAFEPLSSINRTGVAAASAIVLAFFAVGIVMRVQEQSRWREAAARVEGDVAALVRWVAPSEGATAADARVLWGYGTSSPCFALRFGSEWANGLFEKEIARLCPRDWVYNVWSGIAEVPPEYKPLWESKDWEVLVLNSGYLMPDLSPAARVILSADKGVTYVVREGP